MRGMEHMGWGDGGRTRAEMRQTLETRMLISSPRRAVKSRPLESSVVRNITKYKYGGLVCTSEFRCTPYLGRYLLVPNYSEREGPLLLRTIRTILS